MLKFFKKNQRRNSAPAPDLPRRFKTESKAKPTKGMLDTSSPVNVYGTSMDHGYESGPSVDNSRRNSVAARELAVPLSRRRYTMQNRLQVQRPIYDGVRKTSYQMVPTVAQPNFGDDDEMKPQPLSRRRMSVPENVFRRADFAIMRPLRMCTNNESTYEIVSAFDRKADPYHTYMKSMSVYELQAVHSSIVVFDTKTKVKAAVHALAQHGHHASIVSNLDEHVAESVFSMSDCLVAILLVATGKKEIVTEPLGEFMKEQAPNKMIYCTVEKSIWDASRLLSSNRINSIPVFDTAPNQPATPLFFVTTRMILHETVLKLSDFGDAILLHVRQSTIEQKKIGTWFNIIKISEDACIEDAIKELVDRKMSCLPVVNAADQLVGMVTRKDIITEIMSQQGGNNFNVVLGQPVKSLPTMKGKPFCGWKTLTVFETVAKMMNTDKTSMPLVDNDMNILAMVSYSDILSYIQNCTAADRTPSDDRSSSDNSSTSSNSYSRSK